MRANKTLRCILIVSVFFFALASIGLIHAGSACAKDHKKTLLVVSVKEAVTMDPQVSFDGQSPVIWRAVYEPLLNLKEDTYEVIPGLAKRWEISPDGLVYTFHLQQGVKFHDGTPFTADCVKFTLERSKTLGKAGAYVLDPVQEITVLDDHTLQLRLKYPMRSFLSAMAGMYTPSFVVNPKVVKANEIITEKDGEKTSDWGQKYLHDHMVGTGPYRFVRWDHGQQIVLEKFEEYWRGWKDRNFDRIIIKYIEEPATASLMLQRGEADITIGLTDQMKYDLEKTGAEGVVVYKHPSLETYYVSMNCKKGPTADVRVRKAIAYAIDYQKYIKENLEGHAKQMVGMLPSTFLGYNPDLFTYHKDLDKARKLLAEAGYPNGGFTLKYILDPGYEWKRPMGELLQDNLKELGIKVAIREVSNAAWNATLANPDTADHIYGLVWWPFVASPMDYFWSMCHKDAQAEGGWNWVYYDNAEVNERIEKLDSILDDKEWYDNVTRIQQILVDEVPYAPFYEAEYRLPMRDNVRGFIYNGLYTDTFTFYDMWKE